MTRNVEPRVTPGNEESVKETIAIPGGLEHFKSGRPGKESLPFEGLLLHKTIEKRTKDSLTNVLNAKRAAFGRQLLLRLFLLGALDGHRQSHCKEQMKDFGIAESL